jgi:hypothetical protein
MPRIARTPAAPGTQETGDEGALDADTRLPPNMRPERGACRPGPARSAAPEAEAAGLRRSERPDLQGAKGAKDTKAPLVLSARLVSWWWRPSRLRPRAFAAT